jgi:hypothetical protein
MLSSLSEEQRLLLASAIEEARLCDRLLRRSDGSVERLAIGFRVLVDLLLALAAEEPKEGAASPQK